MALKRILLAAICACVIGQVTSYHQIPQRMFRNPQVPSPQSIRPPPGSQLNARIRPFNNNMMLLKRMDARTGQWLKMLIPRIRVGQQAMSRTTGARRGRPGNALIQNTRRMSNRPRSSTQTLRQNRRRMPGTNRNMMPTNNNRVGQNNVRISNGLQFPRFRSGQNNRQPDFINGNPRRLINRRRTSSGVNLSQRRPTFRSQRFNFRTPGNSFLFNNPAMSLSNRQSNGNWAGNFGRGRNDDANFDFDFDDFDRPFDFGDGFDDRFDGALGLNNFDDGIEEDSGDFSRNFSPSTQANDIGTTESSGMFNNGNGPFGFNQGNSDWSNRNSNTNPFGNQEQFQDSTGTPPTNYDMVSTESPTPISKVNLHNEVPIPGPGNEKGVNTMDKVAGNFNKGTHTDSNTIAAAGADTSVLNVDNASFSPTVNTEAANNGQITKPSGSNSQDSVTIEIFSDSPIQSNTNQGSMPIKGLELLSQRRMKKLNDLKQNAMPTPSLVHDSIVNFSPGISTPGTNPRPSGLGPNAFALLGIDASTLISGAISTQGNTNRASVPQFPVNIQQQRQVSSANFRFSGRPATPRNRNMIAGQNQGSLGGLGFDMGSSFAQNNIFGNQNTFGRPMAGQMNGLDKLDFGFK